MSDIQKSGEDIYIKEFLAGKIKVSRVLTYVLLSLWAIVSVAPLVWVALNSFKTSMEILIDALSLPVSFNLENYRSLGEYAQINLVRGFLNSLIISGSVVVLVLFIASMAAFVLSRFRFFLNTPILVLLVSSMLIPQFAVILPNAFIFKAIHINGTYLSVITPHTAGFMNFAIIMIAGFMKTLPVELEESALMDGGGIPRIFFLVVLPLSRPILATTAIMIFLWSYNDLLLPLVYLPMSLQPLSVLMTKVSSAYDTNYGAMMAAITVILIPVVLFYIAAQEWVIRGMTQGAVKA